MLPLPVSIDTAAKVYDRKLPKKVSLQAECSPCTLKSRLSPETLCFMADDHIPDVGLDDALHLLHLDLGLLLRRGTTEVLGSSAQKDTAFKR